MTARRHHYVPQCYLRGFCQQRKKPKLLTIDIRKLSTFTTSPANVAVERDFHAVDLEEFPLDAFEKEFARFESDLSDSLMAIIATRSVGSKKDLDNLLKLVAAISVKNPRNRESFRAFSGGVTKLIMQVLTETPERWNNEVSKAKESGFLKSTNDVNYQQMKNFVDKGEYDVQLLPAYHLGFELPAVDKISPFVFARKWLLLRAPEGSSGFVTSDHPACLMWSDATLRTGTYPPGHGLRGTQLIFPISTELAMIGAYEIFGEERDADETLIAQVNTTIISYAQKQVYARDDKFVYFSPHSGKVKLGSEITNDTFFLDRSKRKFTTND